MYLHQTTESPRFLYWKSLMFFVGIFITGAVCSQDNAPFVELTSVEPGGGDEDLKRLAHHFENVRIVGLGESTHGTHEFSTMRHRVFQYLVEYHGFDTFF
jgi:erythromycin esterase